MSFSRADASSASTDLDASLLREGSAGDAALCESVELDPDPSQGIFPCDQDPAGPERSAGGRSAWWLVNLALVLAAAAGVSLLAITQQRLLVGVQVSRPIEHQLRARRELVRELAGQIGHLAQVRSVDQARSLHDRLGLAVANLEQAHQAPPTILGEAEPQADAAMHSLHTAAARVERALEHSPLDRDPLLTAAESLSRHAAGYEAAVVKRLDIERQRTETMVRAARVTGFTLTGVVASLLTLQALGVFPAMMKRQQRLARQLAESRAALVAQRARQAEQVNARVEALRRANERLEQQFKDRSRAETTLRKQTRVLRLILESIGDGVIVLDAAGRLILHNSAAQAILGDQTLDEPTHLWPRTLGLTDPHDGAALSWEALPMVRAIRGEQVVDQTLRMKRPDDDQAAWLSMTANPLWGADQVTKGVVVAFRDITLQKLSEQSLRESTQMLARVAQEQRAILDHASDFIYRRNAQGRFEYLSPSVRRVTGYTIEQWSAGFLSCVTDSPANDPVRERETSGQAGIAQPTPFRLEIRHADGRLITLEVNEQPVDSDPQGGVIGVVRDVTAQRQAAEQVQRAKEAAEETSRLKSEFVANMSHEIRTPLHGILSFAQLGQRRARQADPDKLEEYFEKIHLSGKRLFTLVNDLLDLAKFESGRMTFAFDHTDVLAVVASVADEFTSLLSERQVRFRCDLPDTPAPGLVDAQRLMQVVRNLLNNAVKFSDPGATIHLRAAADRGRLRISVRDEGMGVPADELQRIFDKFIQSSKTKCGSGGTGLGLAICREIVAAHNGRIWAENHPEGGAVFLVDLPLRSPQAQAAVAARRAAAIASVDRETAAAVPGDAKANTAGDNGVPIDLPHPAGSS